MDGKLVWVVFMAARLVEQTTEDVVTTKKQKLECAQNRIIENSGDSI
jgi:hypothetical protein